jgi:hypothetical protein
MSGKIRGGFITVPRAIFTDANFASEPFTEVQAFLNLVADAGWQPRRVRLARGAVDLERGQLLASTRFLAERWQWPEPRVRRFLHCISGRRANDAQTASQNKSRNETRSYALIDAQPTRDGTIITIRNYDAFQKVACVQTVQSTRNLTRKIKCNLTRILTRHPIRNRRKEKKYQIITYFSFPEGNGEARAPTGGNVVKISKVQATQKIPDPEFAQTPAGTVFGECRNYLQRAAGLSPDQARRVLGRWRKTNSDGEIIDAISRAQREEAQDPISFINGCFRQRLRGQRPTGAMSAIQAMEDVQ